MRQKNIYNANELLRKFYNGTSSLREEEALRELTMSDFTAAKVTESDTAFGATDDAAVMTADHAKRVGTTGGECSITNKASDRNPDGTSQDKAVAVMYELFRQEREVTYPGNIIPLRRQPKFNILFRSVAAAAAAVFVILGATLWRPEPQTVYCYINGKPITDYETAIKQSEIALTIVSESLEKTAEMFDPLDEVGRAMRELEQTGIFNAIFNNAESETDNS